MRTAACRTRLCIVRERDDNHHDSGAKKNGALPTLPTLPAGIIQTAQLGRASSAAAASAV